MRQRQLFSLAGSQTGTPSAASLCCPLAGVAGATPRPPVRPPLCLAARPPPSLPFRHSSPNISGFHNFFFFFDFFRSHKKNNKIPDPAPPFFPEAPPKPFPHWHSCHVLMRHGCANAESFCRSVRWRAPAPPPRIWRPSWCFG